MFTLRCTQKLLRRLPDKPVPEPPTPTTVLGNWYANVMTLGRRPFVLAVSERTFLPVVLPLAPGRTLLPRVREQIGEVLVRMSIGQEAFEAEMEAMEAWAVAKTASRQVVGVLVDFVYLAQSREDLAGAPITLSRLLADTPCGPLKMGRPGEEAVRAFAERYG
ncbi:MAG: DUF6933 domain-containing protein [Nannocystaceae bacterium]|nr:hypothetical protein [bacterium]